MTALKSAEYTMRHREPCVYLLASRPGGSLYVGVTSDLLRRVQEHRAGRGSAHTRRYNIKQLVWYELLDTMELAVAMEKRIKSWSRAEKAKLIGERNPSWLDLFEELV